MRPRIAAYLLTLLLAGLGSALQAHPLQAEPVDHAHVYTFDQFYLPDDPDDYVLNGGWVLLTELRCTLCHAPPSAWAIALATPEAPDLSDVGSRLDIDSLWRFIRSPQHRKPGTQMPGLFAGGEDDPETIEALATYLSSLQTSNPIPIPVGDPDSGRNLYHQIGCVACHDAGTDYEPIDLPPDEVRELPGLGSAPIALADDYPTHALAGFLLDPLASRPSGRMPGFGLAPAEAADIASYLHTGRIPAAFQERQILQIPAQTIDAGRVAFHRHRCSQCHSLPGPRPIDAAPLPPLDQINPHSSSGCLSVTVATGIPRYDLTELQTRALRLALTHLQHHPTPDFDDAQRRDQTLARANCYACHDDAGKGGPEEPRALYLRSNRDPQSLLPPSLDTRWKPNSPVTCAPPDSPAPEMPPPTSLRRPHYLPPPPN